MKKLSGKTALITGGTTGIGYATAKLFIEHGAKVAITGQDPERVNRAGEKLGADVAAIVADISSIGNIDRMVSDVRTKLGNVDILFVNAGVFQGAPLQEADENHFNYLMDINVKGAFFTIQKVVPIMNDGGSIVINSSNANQLGFPGISIYAATKAAVRSFSRTISVDLLDRNIRVNTVSPGPIETPLFDKIGLEEEELNNLTELITSKVPMKRFGSPEEVANAVLFFGSDDSTYITGEEIVIDGGWMNIK